MSLKQILKRARKHKCDCTKPILHIYEDTGVQCDVCGKWLIKVRKTFHKPTSVKPKKIKYNRSKEKRKLKERM